MNEEETFPPDLVLFDKGPSPCFTTRPGARTWVEFEEKPSGESWKHSW